ncbi:MAG TPA: isoprenoid biosynthesis glyoxalase ElbB [Flavobacteriales bacterium]|nr:isoprenoid biosynthesis glyoxalase ElbB [Flavobacteriales bacterium]HRE98732.1 isoprenoid biosynthesis glyoxalase ElbB [Flavobacteriales bacterium]HRJ35981.1 isoprenoid biosynthesis glyoxalase ElbB [Flavobacteriales bacterium]HRJ39460.1 isoprenoid biosynthesis glyoxalase ElbB [Flavobacteriales bacterium]
MKKFAVLLSGCGVYDGSEIQEAVFTLLSISENGASYQCFAPNIDQHHVINHLTGEEMNEKRNALTEAARIARGEIKDLSAYEAGDFDGLVIPGGFGAAKNLTKWAFEGPAGDINAEVKRSILDTINTNKPMAGLCMGPTVIAKALQGTSTKAELSVGTTTEASPYDIGAISQGMEAAGAKAVMKSIREIAIDKQHNIVSAPCYMMEGSIVDVRKNIDQAVKKLIELA